MKLTFDTYEKDDMSLAINNYLKSKIAVTQKELHVIISVIFCYFCGS